MVADPRQQAVEALRVIGEMKTRPMRSRWDRRTARSVTNWPALSPARDGRRFIRPRQWSPAGCARWFKIWCEWLADPTLATMADLLALPETGVLVGRQARAKSEAPGRASRPLDGLADGGHAAPDRCRAFPQRVRQGIRRGTLQGRRGAGEMAGQLPRREFQRRDGTFVGNPRHAPDQPPGKPPTSMAGLVRGSRSADGTGETRGGILDRADAFRAPLPRPAAAGGTGDRRAGVVGTLSRAGQPPGFVRDERRQGPRAERRRAMAQRGEPGKARTDQGRRSRGAGRVSLSVDAGGPPRRRAGGCDLREIRCGRRVAAALATSFGCGPRRAAGAGEIAFQGGRAAGSRAALACGLEMDTTDRRAAEAPERDVARGLSGMSVPLLSEARA